MTSEMARCAVRAGGFTLVELLVSLSVVALVLAATLGLLQQGQQGYLLGAAGVEAQQSARVALERMAREIRKAGFDPAGASFFPIVNPSPTSLTLQNDLNGNSIIDARGETVTYLLRGTTLRRNAGGGAQPIIEGVRALSFAYLDADGVPTGAPERIRTVVIAMTVGPDFLPGAPARDRLGVTLRTQVRLRNR